MADVARAAGVSHQTVSRVLNGSERVSAETRRRVEDAVLTLGYRRNLAARLLASSRSGLVGVASWGTSQFGPANVMLGLEEAAKATRYRLSRVSISEVTPAAFGEAVDILLEQAVEALVVIVPHRTVLRIAQSLTLGIPVVVVEGDLSETPLTAGVDNVEGARIATQHLLDLGHRTVAHLAGPAEWIEASARIEGWRGALEAAGREVPPLRWGGDWSAASGHRTGLSLARERDVTAIFAANDQMALGLMRALHEAGRRVPEDVSVVGFDDLPEARFFTPPLTTVRQPFSTLGHRVMDLVERALGGEVAPSAALVHTELVVRDSSAPPPG